VCSFSFIFLPFPQFPNQDRFLFFYYIFNSGLTSLLLKFISVIKFPLRFLLFFVGCCLHSFSATTDFNKILIMRDNEKGKAKTTRDGGWRCGGVRAQEVG
jgi:hypothetical protein